LLLLLRLLVAAHVAAPITSISVATVVDIAPTLVHVATTFDALAAIVASLANDAEVALDVSFASNAATVVVVILFPALDAAATDDVVLAAASFVAAAPPSFDVATVALALVIIVAIAAFPFKGF
jgi:hypothetical protein